MRYIDNEVRQMDTDKMKKFKNAIQCAHAFATLFTPICMGVMSFLVGLGIVNKNAYLSLLIIGCIILFLGLTFVDELDFLIRHELGRRKLISDLEETNKTD